MGTTTPTLHEFAEAEGFTPEGSVCGVCRLYDKGLIEIVDDNERLHKNDPIKVPRKVVSAYLASISGKIVSVGAIEGHAKRHVK